MAKTAASAPTTDLDLNDVRVFTRVVEAGGFTKAAKALGMPTSTVSRRVARLEQVLGVRLLQRTTRKLSLTDPGGLYYERCARVMAELDDAGRAVAEAQATPRGRVRVTAPVDFAPTTALVARFLERYENVRVELDLTNRRVDLVEEGYDVALRAGRMPDSTMVAYKLQASHFQLVASPDYLRKHGVPESVRELSKHECIIFGALGAQATWQLRDERGKVSVTVSGRIAVNHMVAAKHAAAEGLGIAMIPSAFFVEELARGDLVSVLPSACQPTGDLWLVVPSRYMAPACRAFVDFVREHFKTIELA